MPETSPSRLGSEVVQREFSPPNAGSWNPADSDAGTLTSARPDDSNQTGMSTPTETLNSNGSSGSFRSQKTARVLSAGLFGVAAILLIVVWAVPLFTLKVPLGSSSDVSTIPKYTVYLYHRTYKAASVKTTTGSLFGFPNLGGTDRSDGDGGNSISTLPDPILQAIVKPGLMRSLAAAVVGLVTTALIMALVICIAPLGRAVYMHCRKHHDNNSTESRAYLHRTHIGRWCSDKHSRWKARKAQWQMETLPSVFEVAAAVTTALTAMAAIAVCTYCLVVSKGVFALPAGSISQAWITVSSVPIFASIASALCMWLALACLLFTTPSWANREPIEVWNETRDDRTSQYKIRRCRHVYRAVLFILTAITVLVLWVVDGSLEQVNDNGTGLYFNAVGRMPWRSSGAKQASSSALSVLNDQQNVRAWVNTARIVYAAAFVSLLAILPLIVVEATSPLECWKPRLQTDRHGWASCRCCCAGKNYSRNRCMKHVSIALAFFCVAAFVLIAASASISLNAWANVASVLNSATTAGPSGARLSFLPSSIAMGCLAMLILLTGAVILIASYLIGPRRIEDWLLEARHAWSLGAIVLALLALTLHILPLVPDFKLFRLAAVQLPSAGLPSSAGGFDFYMLQLCPVTAFGGPLGPCSINVAMPFLNANVSGSTELTALVADSASSSGTRSGVSAKWAYSNGVPLYRYWFPVIFSCWLLSFFFALRYEKHVYKRGKLDKYETAPGTWHFREFWRKTRNTVSWRIARPWLLIVFSVLLVSGAWLNTLNVFLIQKAIAGDFGHAASGGGTGPGKRSTASEDTVTTGRVDKDHYIDAAVVIASVIFTFSAIVSFLSAYRLLRPGKSSDIEVARAQYSEPALPVTDVRQSSSDGESPSASVVTAVDSRGDSQVAPKKPVHQTVRGPHPGTVSHHAEEPGPALFTKIAKLAETIEEVGAEGEWVYVYDTLKADHIGGPLPQAFANLTAYWVKSTVSNDRPAKKLFYEASETSGKVEMTCLQRDTIAWRTPDAEHNVNDDQS